MTGPWAGQDWQTELAKHSLPTTGPAAPKLHGGVPISAIHDADSCSPTECRASDVVHRRRCKQALQLLCIDRVVVRSSRGGWGGAGRGQECAKLALGGHRYALTPMPNGSGRDEWVGDGKSVSQGQPSVEVSFVRCPVFHTDRGVSVRAVI